MLVIGPIKFTIVQPLQPHSSKMLFFSFIYNQCWTRNQNSRNVQKLKWSRNFNSAHNCESFVLAMTVLFSKIQFIAKCHHKANVCIFFSAASQLCKFDLVCAIPKTNRKIVSGHTKHIAKMYHIFGWDFYAGSRVAV